MGRGKSKKVDKNVPTSNPQIENTNEVGPQSLRNEAVCCTGITGVGTVDVPLKVLPHFSTSRVGDMSLPGIDRMMGTSERDSYQNFMGAKVDNSKAQSVGNFMSCSSRELSLGSAQDGKEMGSNDNLVDCVVQSDYPETLDRSFLTLGVGSNTEARAKSSAPSRGSIGKNDGAINTQFNPSHEQSGYGSTFSPDLRLGLVSGFQAYAGGVSSMEENKLGSSYLKTGFVGLPSIVQNAGDSSNASTLQNAGESFDASAFSGVEQNVDSFSPSEYNLGVFGSTSSNFGLSPSQMSPMPQTRVAHSLLKAGDHNFGAAFANMDPNQRFGHSGVAPKLMHASNQSGVAPHRRLYGSPILRGRSGLPPNQGFRSLSNVSPIVHSNSQSGSNVHIPQRMAAWPSLSSYMTSEYATAASDQVRNSNMGSILNFQRGTSVAAPAPAPGSSVTTRNWYQSDELSARNGGASHVSSSVPFSKNLGVQAVGQVIPFARGSGPAMTSELPAGASLKRKAAQPPPALSQVPIRKRRSVKPSIGSYTSNTAQDAPSVAPLPPVLSQAPPVPSLAQYAPAVSTVKLTASPPLRPLAPKAPAPQLLSKATPAQLPRRRSTPVFPRPRMSSPPHRIQRQDTERLQLSGYNCLLCKRNLSYTPAPEGPVTQPAIPPPVAVLACGHCFHDVCLNQMTPKDEADNPPCIACAIGEN
ncbi:hypothetical protein COLO4_26771 [Corchorus olitorius]|uniref:RING-type domain-containing protein n=1 Tax=Corchorus olitorius TaxID=93759 RepID=A0A1R3HUD2_9ROSI|nr:hypothetical protein COLO4_26771 [Corchorus olitorius]